MVYLYANDVIHSIAAGSRAVHFILTWLRLGVCTKPKSVWIRLLKAKPSKTWHPFKRYPDKLHAIGNSS